MVIILLYCRVLRNIYDALHNYIKIRLTLSSGEEAEGLRDLASRGSTVLGLDNTLTMRGEPVCYSIIQAG